LGGPADAVEVVTSKAGSTGKRRERLMRWIGHNRADPSVQQEHQYGGS
jgi:hypothetical protein